MDPRLRGDDAWSCRELMRMTPVRLGVLAGIVALVLDQVTKLWLLYGFELARKGVVQVLPFFDLVLAWNTGISYGWFSGQGPTGQILMLAFKAVAIVALAIWMARSTTKLACDHRSRSDHRRGDRQCDRPAGLWRGGRFCPASR